MNFKLTILALAVLQGGQTVDKKTPAFEEMIRMRVVLTVPGMDAATVRRNLVYKIADGHPLHMDVYSPSGPQRPRPAVILIHGGPIPRIGAKNMGVFVSYGQLLAASGFVAVAFDYRFLAQGQLAAAGGDVADHPAHARVPPGPSRPLTDRIGSVLDLAAAVSADWKEARKMRTITYGGATASTGSWQARTARSTGCISVRTPSRPWRTTGRRLTRS